MRNIDLLRERLKKVCCLRETSELLSWDQETMMPSGSGAARADHIAVVTELAHEILVGDETRELLDKAKADGVEEGTDDYYFLRRCEREYQRATCVPQKVVSDLAAAASRARDTWVRARLAKDFEMFADDLKAVVDLTREAAKCYGYEEHIYDALLEGYEPGLKTSQVRKVFAGLRSFLIDLVKRIGDAKQVDCTVLQQNFDIAAQRVFCRRLSTDMGYDWTRGRTDDVIHPFCTSFSSRDVRITNIYKEEEVTRAIFGALHETGHAIYEQGTPEKWMHTFLEGGASMGIHESQSRLWENVIGRSYPFWEYYYGSLRTAFPRQLDNADLNVFWRAINKVMPSFVRTEADEVTYNLHIMIRFEIETALMEGKLEVKDIPSAWNDLMHDYLGITPPDHTAGCLQDVHWPMGLFGYFPTYALGNLFASQQWEKMQEDISGLDDHLRHGRLGVIREWLASHIYCHGQALLPEELIVKATGRPLSAEPFMNYLEKKYAAIYNL
ncbi:MAG: carboxypeptidase M32 [bacterium]|nr:carboxypeptidase M32 [bacterium]